MPRPSHARSITTANSGTILVGTAALLWGFNGSMVRLLTDRGVAPLRIAELRSLSMTVVLVGALLLVRRELLVIARGDLPRVVAFGLVLALVEGSSLIALQRLQIAVALIVQFTAPILLLLWLRCAHGRALPRPLWIAAALSLAGSACVVRAYHPGELDVLGLVGAVVSAVGLALQLLGGERAGYRIRPITLLAWASLSATAFWLVVQPLWTFPVDRLDVGRDAGTVAAVVILGTIVPALSLLLGLQRIPAARAAVVASVELPFGGLFALLIHGETLAADQLLGGAVVLAAVIFIQRRPLTAYEWVRADRSS